MSFNIEWGGARISFENVVEAIKRSRADIVGIQEAEGNLQRLAGELGWYFDLRNYVISRYPVIEPPVPDGQYAYVEVEPGRRSWTTPLAPGDYVIRLVKDDGFEVLAESAPFTVK